MYLHYNLDKVARPSDSKTGSRFFYLFNINNKTLTQACLDRYFIVKNLLYFADAWNFINNDLHQSCFQLCSFVLVSFPSKIWIIVTFLNAVYNQMDVAYSRSRFSAKVSIHDIKVILLWTLPLLSSSCDCELNLWSLNQCPLPTSDVCSSSIRVWQVHLVYLHSKNKTRTALRQFTIL